MYPVRRPNGFASPESGIPYQTLIHLYLRDGAERQRKLSLEGKASA